MAWRAFNKQGEELREETHGRPVAQGEEGNLLVIAQEDFGRSVAVDLHNGIIAFDYESLGMQNGTLELAGDKLRLWICEETNIAAEYMHLTHQFEYAKDENKKKISGPDGKFVKVKTDILSPLIWRPIWFTRYTNGTPTKVIGAQTTTPALQGGKNIKKIISLFEDGRIGID